MSTEPSAAESASTTRHREYWMGLLSQGLGRASLLVDGRRTAAGEPHRLVFGASGELDRAIRQVIGDGSPLLLISTVIAGLAATLRRYSTAPRALIGVPATAELAEPNAVMVAVDISNPALTFRDLLRTTRDSVLAAQEHQDYPVEVLAADLGLKLSRDRCPLFDIMVRCDGLHGKALQLGQDLTFEVSSGHGLEIAVGFEGARWRRETVERLVRQVTSVLEQGLAGLKTPLSELGGPDGTETRRLVALGRGRRVALPPCACIHQLFERQARLTPDSIALRSDDTELTYAELDRRANRVAHHLLRLGVDREDLVGLLMERSWQLIAAMLGIHKAGAAYLALDPSYPEQRTGFMIADARPRVVLTQARLARGLEGAAVDTVCCLDEGWHEVMACPETAPALDLDGRNLAYCLYTSGSTGRPKGVQVEHRALLNRMVFHQAAYPMTAADRVIHKTSLCFDGSVWEICAALAAGATLVVAPPDAHRDLDSYVDTVVRFGVTVTEIVPTLLELLVEHERFAECGSLRLVFSVGEPLSVALAERFLERSPARLVHAYGPTEATVDATSGFFEPGPHPRLAPLGRPLDNMEVHVLDRWLRPVPQGAPGELYIGGPQLARGYLGSPRLTAERFVPSPFAEGPGERLYRPGDLARVQADGQLEFLGRVDHQVKLHGERIELGEIESAISEHQAVRQCHVVVRELGQSDRRLVAYLVARAGLDVAELRARLATRLTPAMMPSAVVLLDAMPLLPNGKVDRAALPDPEQCRPELSSRLVAPSSTAERRLAEIWQEVLRLDTVGMDDNFFELGGDSIMTLLVASRASAAGMAVTPRHIYEHQTIRSILEALDSAPATHTIQGPVSGAVPLTPIQRLLFDGSPPNPHHFCQAFLFRVEPLRPELLEQALAALVAHHDALRHRFVLSPDGVEQRCLAVDAPPGELAGVVDLSQHDPVQAEHLIEEKIRETQRRLHIGDGPMLRAVIFRGSGEAAGGQRLLLAIHHLVVDGVSWRVLLEDLDSAYQQLANGAEVTLPPRTTSFQEWAQRLEGYATTEGLLRQVELWRRELPEVPPLPLDLPAAALDNTHASRAEVQLVLDQNATAELETASRGPRGPRMVDMVITALARCLAAWSGNPKVLLDLETHGRQELFDGLDLSRSVGWFTSVFPLAVTADPAGDPGAQARAVRERLERVPDGGIGYGVLRYLAAPEVRQEMDALPRPEVLFNYLGRLDELNPPGSVLELAEPTIAGSESRRGRRRHVLEVGCFLKAGQLHARWRYSANLHRASTVEGLANAMFEETRRIARRCLRDEETEPKREDFPLSGLGRGDLDKVLARVGARRRSEQP